MDFITISNKSYRVECNFNALISYMDMNGLKDMTFLSSDLSVKEWAELMLASINEGERLEGHDHNLSMEDLGTASFYQVANAVKDFIVIFSRQNTAGDTEEKKI